MGGGIEEMSEKIYTKRTEHESRPRQTDRQIYTLQIQLEHRQEL